MGTPQAFTASVAMLMYKCLYLENYRRLRLV